MIREEHAWPSQQLGEALQALGRHAGLEPRGVAAPVPPDGAGTTWMVAAADAIGLEVEPVVMSYGECARVLQAGGPMLVRLGRDAQRYVAVLRRRGAGVEILPPSLKPVTIPVEPLVSSLVSHLVASVSDGVEQILDEGGVHASARTSARAALLSARLEGVLLGGVYALRLPPGASLPRALRQAGLVGPMAGIPLLHALQYVVFLGAWGLLGLGALQGRLDTGWLLAWFLLMLCTVPLRMAVTWLQGRVAIGAGAVLKKRLMVGALRSDPDAVRRQGSGKLLGQVIESEAVESLALSGGFAALVAVIELAGAAWVLSRGLGGIALPLMLVGWTLLAFFLAHRYLRQRSAWTERRLDMTGDLVERMEGHRTLLAQQRPSRWHDGEDDALAAYLRRSRALDESQARIQAGLPRGWMALALGVLVFPIVGGQATPAAVAVTLGGLLLSLKALSALTAGLVALSGAWISWRQVAPLHHAAACPGPAGDPRYAIEGAEKPAEDRVVLDAHGLVFRYRAGAAPVFSDLSLRIRAGDRLLLEGPSGCGKSTLASLLVGLRQGEAGLLLLEGLDRGTLGEAGWRRRAASAPQFHENRVIAAPFAFNLLMGRDWPPSQAISRRRRRSASSWGSGRCSSACPAASCNSWGSPAGSSPTVRRAASSSRAPCSRGPSSSSWTRASLHSTQPIWSAVCAPCCGGRRRCWSSPTPETGAGARAFFRARPRAVFRALLGPWEPRVG